MCVLSRSIIRTDSRLPLQDLKTICWESSCNTDQEKHDFEGRRRPRSDGGRGSKENVWGSCTKTPHQPANVLSKTSTTTTINQALRHLQPQRLPPSGISTPCEGLLLSSRRDIRTSGKDTRAPMGGFSSAFSSSYSFLFSPSSPHLRFFNVVIASIQSGPNPGFFPFTFPAVGIHPRPIPSPQEPLAIGVPCVPGSWKATSRASIDPARLIGEGIIGPH